jgi:hypothetical protein
LQEFKLRVQPDIQPPNLRISIRQPTPPIKNRVEGRMKSPNFDIQNFLFDIRHSKTTWLRRALSVAECLHFRKTRKPGYAPKRISSVQANVNVLPPHSTFKKMPEVAVVFP